MKVIAWEEVSNTTRYSLSIEYKGKEYQWTIVHNEDDSDTYFYDPKGNEIDLPEWTDDLDFWELLEQAQQEDN